MFKKSCDALADGGAHAAHHEFSFHHKEGAFRTTDGSRAANDSLVFAGSLLRFGELLAVLMKLQRIF